MARKTPPSRPASRRSAPAAAPAPAPAQERKERKLIPDDRWVTAELIDAEAGATAAGAAKVTLELEVTSPRGYAGRSLFYQLHKGLDKSLAALKEEFPTVDFLDADDVWEQLGHNELRVHVFIDPERDSGDPKNPWPARNRVASIYRPRVRGAAAAAAEPDDDEIPF